MSEEEDQEDFSRVLSLVIFIKRSAISLASNSLHISSIKNFFLRSLSFNRTDRHTERERERFLTSTRFIYKREYYFFTHHRGLGVVFP